MSKLFVVILLASVLIGILAVVPENVRAEGYPEDYITEEFIVLMYRQPIELAEGYLIYVSQMYELNGYPHASLVLSKDGKEVDVIHNLMQGQRFSLDDGEKFHFEATLTVVNRRYWVPLNDSTGNGVGGDVCSPTPPQNIQTTAGNGDVDLNWNAPSNDGGYPITECKIYRKPGNLTTIEVSPSTATVNVNATKQFNATAKDQYGWLIPDVVFTWTSSNETVGTITDAGVFTALAVGTITVKAENGTVNGTANVTVQEAVQPVLTTIEVSPSTATVNINATEQFNATAKDQYGWLIPDVVITWSCSNETVGTTTDAGLFTALVVGTTTVKAENGTVNGTANVTVLEPVPQNLTITNLKADPSTGVNKDNPTTVSATITSSAELELVTLFAIDTQNYQSKQYALYAEDIPVDGDDYSADWDATEFKVQNETTSSGTKPVFVGKTDIWDTTTYYGVPGNLTINATSGTAFAVALFNTGDLKLSKIIEPQAKESYSVDPGNTTFAPFAMDATDRDTITDLWVLLGSLEPLDAVTLTGTAPDCSISLVKTQVPNGDYVVGLAALDEVGDRDYNETTVSTTEDYAVSISADTTGITVAPNVKATYTLTVKNEGTKTDNYTLSIESKADVAELNIENITNLKAGETQDVSLNVADASVGTYTVNVTVKSLTETSVTDMVSTLTTVKVTPTPTPRRGGGGGGGGGGGVSDSDGDGYSDIEEIIAGTDPYDPCDPNPACIACIACIGEKIIKETAPEPTPPPSFQDLIEEEIKKLAPGRILYNPSKEMTLGITERVEIRIAKNLTENLRKGLKGRGEPQIVNVSKVNTTMEVSLIGENFYIELTRGKRQLVLGKGFAEWVYYVTPLKNGNKSLALIVSAIIRLPNGKEEKHETVFEKIIYVKVYPIEEELKKYESKLILFDPPKEMTVGREETVKVSIAKNITENMIKETAGVSPSSTIIMEQNLKGRKFNIKQPIGSRSVVLHGEGFNEWFFLVTPAKHGNKSLALIVNTIMTLPNGKKEIHETIFKKNIKVKFNLISSIQIFIENNWQWIVVTIIIPIVIVVFQKKDSLFLFFSNKCINIKKTLKLVISRIFRK